MRTNSTKLICGAIFALGLSHCGGGGSDSDNDGINVSGSWSGALTKVTDNCNPAIGQTLNFTHTVNQNESAVTLSSNNGLTYIGNVVGGNGFSVDGNRNIEFGNQTCGENTRIEYDQISSDSDTSADVIVSGTVTCPSLNSCTFSFEGTASRAGVAEPQPTTVPNATPQPGATIAPAPITGGCADINQNPANDSYEGDGGCGISDAVFRFEQQTENGVVTLEPFGANGLTTFIVSPANTSTANSVRTDLTVNGTEGYTCSMTCSPATTFTVRCVKEGGESCVEKF